MNIDWKTQRFNGANADMLGKAAALAYMDDMNIAKTAQSWKMDLIRFFSLRETQAYIVGDDKTWILAFRGTTDRSEAPPPGSRIHFMAAMALAIGPLFLAIVVLNGLGTGLVDACRQS